jgi:hypothetical protein
MVEMYILAGQSNMQGAGKTNEIPKTFKKLSENIKLFEDGEFREVLHKENFGPEFGFASALKTLHSSFFSLDSHRTAGHCRFHKSNAED